MVSPIIFAEFFMNLFVFRELYKMGCGWHGLVWDADETDAKQRGLKRIFLCALWLNVGTRMARFSLGRGWHGFFWDADETDAKQRGLKRFFYVLCG
ncbi:hypothetical protein FAQ01_12080 [Flavobacterium aquatile]|uniref:hypothetical protein n=1 Tax=Flavobacterium aquatile TaxID=245 RepID=UPI0011424D31|nr:hypothetical protein [Flavobacterium aquatile]GEC78338.1 hypothetical protein FAQ01_12080 [Flavobacterium aquatile]